MRISTDIDSQGWSALTLAPTDLVPWASRALQDAYGRRERARCAQDDFSYGFVCGLVWANSWSAFSLASVPSKRPPIPALLARSGTRHPAYQDLSPLAARACEAAYLDGPKRYKSDRRDFVAGFIAALRWTNSRSSLRTGFIPVLRNPRRTRKRVQRPNSIWLDRSGVTQGLQLVSIP